MPLGHKHTCEVQFSFSAFDMLGLQSDDKMKSDVAVRHVALWTPLSYTCVAAVYRAPGELQCKVTGAPHMVSVAAPELCPGRMKTARDRL